MATTWLRCVQAWSWRIADAVHQPEGSRAGHRGDRDRGLGVGQGSWGRSLHDVPVASRSRVTGVGPVPVSSYVSTGRLPARGAVQAALCDVYNRYRSDE